MCGSAAGSRPRPGSQLTKAPWRKPRPQGASRGSLKPAKAPGSQLFAAKHYFMTFFVHFGSRNFLYLYAGSRSCILLLPEIYKYIR